MANIQTSLKNWSTTEASNQPDTADTQGMVGDLRAIQAGVRYLRSQDTIASATTCDLGTKDAESLTITGTTTITGLGTVSAGIIKRVVFSGILTLTHNGTSLILPGSASITTAVGDSATFESLGAGNWKCTHYQKITGAPITVGSYLPLSGGTLTGEIVQAVGSNVASSSTIDLSSLSGNSCHVTGTTPITAVTLEAGKEVIVIFDGALTLTHHATNNNLPGGANITTVAGDRAIYWSDGTTVYCVNYERVSAMSGSYTPTLTNVTNVAASTAFTCYWYYSPDKKAVTVYGKFNVDPTAAAASELGISLPIASTLSATEKLSGVASEQTTGNAKAIRADTTNNRAAVVWTAVTITDHSNSFMFTYLVT